FAHRRHLRSFPTRRSSDLVTATTDVAASGTGRNVSGNVLDIQADDDRFFVNTNAPDASVDPGSGVVVTVGVAATNLTFNTSFGRSEEHTSELQSRSDLVCR